MIRAPIFDVSTLNTKMIYITSDLHFSHSNIVWFCPDTRSRFVTEQGIDYDHLRSLVYDPASKLEPHQKRDLMAPIMYYMNQQIIDAINATVKPDDVLYILGDVSFAKVPKTIQLLRQLKCKNIILIRGNHDPINLPEFDACFSEVCDYKEISHDGFKVIMSHYPILEWNRMHHGSIHFHGHTHGTPKEIHQYRSADVGFDATGKIVVTMSEMIAKVKNNPIGTHHQA